MTELYRDDFEAFEKYSETLIGKPLPTYAHRDDPIISMMHIFISMELIFLIIVLYKHDIKRDSFVTAQLKLSMDVENTPTYDDKFCFTDKYIGGSYHDTIFMRNHKRR